MTKPIPMCIHQSNIAIHTRGKGLIEISSEAEKAVLNSGIATGILHIFCRHTSCSLMIMENADPSARLDLEGWMERMVPANDPQFTHTLEGEDDMPSHIKMALTRTSETIPIQNGRLRLGTWQGLFLWEHRHRSHQREIVFTCLGA